MKNKALIGVCILSVLAFSLPVYAEKPAKSEMQISQVLEKLKSKGFSVVTEIALNKDGKYNVIVINDEGGKGSFVYDEKSNEIVNDQKNKSGLTALAIAKKVEAAGYYNILKIDTKWFTDKYLVTAYDKNGKKVTLEVDALTGNIKSK